MENHGTETGWLVYKCQIEDYFMCNLVLFDSIQNRFWRGCSTIMATNGCLHLSVLCPHATGDYILQYINNRFHLTD